MAWVTEATAEAMPAHLATSGFGTPTYSMSSGYQCCQYAFLCSKGGKKGRGRRIGTNTESNAVFVAGDLQGTVG